MTVEELKQFSVERKYEQVFEPVRQDKVKSLFVSGDNEGTIL